MNPTTRRPDPDLLRAAALEFTQVLQAWVLAAAQVFVGLFERQLGRDLKIEMRGFVREAAYELRRVVFALAILHIRMRVRRRRTTRPGGVPPGFRRRRASGSNRRRARRGVPLRGRSIAARLAWLRSILSNLKAWTARMAARMEALTCLSRMSAVAPPAMALRALSAPGCAGVDTS